MNLTLNILTTLSARIVTLGLSLASSIILARWLGPEGRGVFALVLLLPGLAMSLGLLGFEQANAVFSGLVPERRRELFWQSVAIAVGVGCVITLGCIWFVTLGGFGGMIRGSVVLYVLALSSVPARMASDYWSAILRGMNRIVLLNVLEVGMKVVSLSLLALFVLWLGLGVTGAVWADFALAVSTAIVLVVLLARLGVGGRPSIDRALWKRTWAFAFPTYCAGVMTFLNYRVDQFIIAALLPAEDLGFYVIAVDLAERLWILTGAVATALLPHLTNSRQRDPALVAVVSRHVMLWTGGACLLLFLLVDHIVSILYSPAFVPAAAALRWLLPGILVLTAGKVVVAEMAAREKIRFTVWLSAVSIVVNIVANFVLIPYMGISGAALASSISYSLVSVVVLWYYLHETRLPWSVLVPRRSDLSVYAALSRRLGGYSPLRDSNA